MTYEPTLTCRQGWSVEERRHDPGAVASLETIQRDGLGDGDDARDGASAARGLASGVG